MSNDDAVSNTGPGPDEEQPSDGHYVRLRVLQDGRWAASMTVKGVTRDTTGTSPIAAVSALATMLADDLAACLVLAHDYATQIARLKEQGK